MIYLSMIHATLKEFYMQWLAIVNIAIASYIVYIHIHNVTIYVAAYSMLLCRHIGSYSS